MTLTSCPHCHDPLGDITACVDDDGTLYHYGCFLTREKRRDEGDRDMEAEHGAREQAWRDSDH